MTSRLYPSGGEPTIPNNKDDPLARHFTTPAPAKDNTPSPYTSTGGTARRRPEHPTSRFNTPIHTIPGASKYQGPSPSLVEKYLSNPGLHRSSPVGLFESTPPYNLPSRTTTTSLGGGSTAVPTRTTSGSIATASSSDIRARLQQLALTPGSINSTRERSRSSPGDFFISAVRASTTPGTGPPPTSTSGGSPAESLAARARANQLQAELQLRDLEIKKLAAAAADARRQRDEQKDRAERLIAEAQATRKDAQHGLTTALNTTAPLSSTDNSSEVAQLKFQLTQLADALEKKGSEVAALRTAAAQQLALVNPTPAPIISPALQQQTSDAVAAQAALSELRKEAEALRQRAELAASELQGQRARAEAAEDRARLAEARAGAEASATDAAEVEIRNLRQKLGPLQTEVRRLTSDIAAAQDKASMAETALAEERARNHGMYSKSGGSQKAGELVEAALTAQVRALATQLKAAKSEAATAQQELASLKAEAQGRSSTQESATAELLSANRELEAALTKAAHDLQARAVELEEIRGTVSRLSTENAALHAALKERDESLARQSAAALEATSRADAATGQLAAANLELRAAKSQVAQLEDAMARQGGGPGSNAPSSSGPSPLRDVVSALRDELHEREMRLATVEEELAAERQRAGELHRQVLDQAVELDDLQREAHRGDDLLRQQLEQARREALAVAAELATVQERAAALEAQHAGAAPEAVEELRKERNVLLFEVQNRDAEIMALQGQLNMMVARGGDVESWLMGP